MKFVGVFVTAQDKIGTVVLSQYAVTNYHLPWQIRNKKDTKKYLPVKNNLH